MTKLIDLLAIMVILTSSTFALKFAYKKGKEAQNFYYEFNSLKNEIINCNSYCKLLKHKDNIIVLYQKYSSFERDINILQKNCLKRIQMFKPKV